MVITAGLKINFTFPTNLQVDIVIKVKQIIHRTATLVRHYLNFPSSDKIKLLAEFAAKQTRNRPSRSGSRRGGRKGTWIAVCSLPAISEGQMNRVVAFEIFRFALALFLSVDKGLKQCQKNNK